MQVADRREDSRRSHPERLLDLQGHISLDETATSASGERPTLLQSRVRQRSRQPELTCGLPIGLEQVLCCFRVRGAALEPPGNENINPRGKSPLKRGQHGPRIEAQIEWFLDIITGAHFALLPFRRREQPCAESYTLALRISPAWS